MRIVYEDLFECGPVGDGDGDTHLFDQKALNQRIERLLTLNTSGGR
ncbi:MAG: hypothetical protein JWM72_3997 [Actinomycetia bacterium]|jgi:hypothetical protein|nr:hypothetical protein [Actinomycetes bacterium]MDQ1459158.1 hypothetical protein [Actinomycetota bacterium]